MRTVLVILTSLFLALVTVHCGSNARDYEDYGSMSSLTLSDAEHTGGYGRNECLVCHNAALNIHQGSSAIDPERLVQLAREQGEAAYCMTCHGANGSQ